MCFSCYPLFAFFAFFLLVLVPPPLVKTPLAAAAAGIASPPLFSNSGSTFAPASFSPPFFLCSFAMSLAHTLRQVTREASPGIDAVAKRHWSASTSEAAKSQIFMLPEDVVVTTRGCAARGSFIIEAGAAAIRVAGRWRDKLNGNGSRRGVERSFFCTGTVPLGVPEYSSVAMACKPGARRSEK